MPMHIHPTVDLLGVRGLPGVLTPEPEPTAPSETTARFDDDFARVLEGLGLDESDLETLPVWDLPGWQLVLAIVSLAVVVLILRAIYRGMQHSRLRLEYHADRPPGVTWPAVRRYAWTPLALIPLWFIAILLILITAAKRGDSVRPGEEVLFAAAVIVGASRLLAHVNREGAHELAKAVPLTLITLILVSGQTTSAAGFVVILLLLAFNLGSLLYYLLLLAALDVLFTVMWLAWSRAQWRRRHREGSASPPGWWQRVRQTLARGWAATESGPSTKQAEGPIEVEVEAPIEGGDAAETDELRGSDTPSS